MTDAGPAGAPLDLTAVLSEINVEVERRRASGELPRQLERELDRIFADLAPVDTIDADFDSIVKKVERSAVLDIRPPTTSAYPGAAQAKQIVAKATAFSMRHLASQVSGLFQALARALRLLGERVDRLEAAQDGKGLAAWDALAGQAGIAAGSPVSESWTGFVVEQLLGTSGRVLHTSAADGRLVRHLVDAGLDAYGVEPSEEAALAAADVVPDIRSGDGLGHLRTLPANSLGGLVLSGLVEQLDVAGLVELVDVAWSRLVPGAPLVVVSVHPAAWLRSGPPLVVDLAPGRPVHAETWVALLRRAGFASATVRLADRPELVALPRPEALDPDPLGDLVAACRENFNRLAESSFGPGEFAVSARRPI